MLKEAAKCKRCSPPRVTSNATSQTGCQAAQPQGRHCSQGHHRSQVAPEGLAVIPQGLAIGPPMGTAILKGSGPTPSILPPRCTPMTPVPSHLQTIPTQKTSRCQV